MSEDLESGFGASTAYKGSGFRTVKIGRLNDKNPVQRRAIMPAMFDARSDMGGWKRFHKVHWGFKIPQPGDPSKTLFLLFECVEQGHWDHGQFVVDVACPQCVRYNKAKKDAEAREAALKAKGAPADEIKAILSPFDEYFKSFSCDRKWIMNSLTEGGEFEPFAMSNKTMKAFGEELDRTAKKERINPLSIKSLVTWEFTRIGTGKRAGEMSEKVEPFRESIEVAGQRAERTKITALTPEQLRRALATCVDLDTLDKTDIVRLTYDQVKQLAECSGDPEEVAKIAKPKAVTRTAPPQEVPPPEEVPVRTTMAPPAEVKPDPTPPKSEPAAEVKTETKVEVKAEQPPEAAAVAAMTREQLYQSLGLPKSKK
jgi:hypothetical protein